MLSDLNGYLKITACCVVCSLCQLISVIQLLLIKMYIKQHHVEVTLRKKISTEVMCYNADILCKLIGNELYKFSLKSF